MIRALLDTNILLDVLLKREPFVKDAAALWQANEQGLFEGSISAITPVNVFYIARKIKDNATARKIVEELLVVFRVVPCGFHDPRFSPRRFPTSIIGAMNHLFRWR